MHDTAPPSRAQTWLSTIPALLILLFTVVQGTSEILQSRMLSVGEERWPGYAELRYDPDAPACDLEQLQADEEAACSGTADDDDGDLLDDLLGDDEPAAAPDGDDPDGFLDDLVDVVVEEEAPDPQAEAEAAQDDLLDDLLGDDEPAGEGDLLDDLMGDDDAAPAADSATCQAYGKARDRCQVAHDRHDQLMAMLTPTLRAYRSVDTGLQAVTNTAQWSTRPALVLLLILCSATATLMGHHISLRPIDTRLDNTVSSLAQVLVMAMGVFSCIAHREAILTSGVERVMPWMPVMWAAGFALVGACALVRLARPPADLDDGGTVGHALLTAPLYVAMGVISGIWFFGLEDHPAGLSIYLTKITEHAGLYIQVGLYVWAGMLLKRTFMAHRFFDVLRPWKLTPELMAAVVVTLAAIPTAYSGASGIFVIAAGAIIYDELRQAGARNQLALAATAMSGSLGVVLSPCLLVVIVASLNKQVTTSMLFSAGQGVFVLTATLFVAALLITRTKPLNVAPLSEAVPASFAEARKLVPYLMLGAAVLGFYALVLDAWLNEHNAPKVLLVVLLVIMAWEGVGRGGTEHGTVSRIGLATTETTGHIGALLMLMTLSIAFGGVVERADVMSLVPADLGSPVTTMAALTVMLVFVGMLMDPYGAVILVSATLAQVAYANQIDPLHFWMVVLVAFELGYLTPPVALNHLLTRAVVGRDADVDDLPADAGFWLRHERLLLPVTVMGIALIIVAFGPLVV